jgi:hexosaminidase
MIQRKNKTMPERWSVILVLIFFISAASCKKDVIPDMPHLVPVPQSMVLGEGYFTLTNETSIHVGNVAGDEAKIAIYLANQLSTVTGKAVKVGATTRRSLRNPIVLSIDPALEGKLGREGYHFFSSRKGILIEAASSDGLFYGVQTLFQLLPPQVYGNQAFPDLEWKVPAVEITDKPVFSWRGMHLDVSRHFFPKEFVKKYIDLIAMHKMNIFHWHLTDDNGWRIEIKKYPLLTEVAAWRVDREDKPWGQRDLIKPGEKATYGGFYTQEDIREIVQYAADRHITIIPEIEMPGHSYEVFAAYPQYSCRGEKLSVLPGSYWPNTDIFCAGNDETFQFLDDIIGEVAALFPGQYIHIGGDEADKTIWKQCPKCQKRIKDEKLKDENELQSYFVRRVEKIVQSKGKKLIGWDEILEGGLAPEATVMSWRGYEGGIEAARQGHDVIMCPVSHCYFDYYQADPETEPLAIGGYITLKKVYSFQPVPPVLSEAEAKHILGAQGNLWTEFIPSPEQAEYMALPRMAALAEVTWSLDTLRNWESFNERMTAQYDRYKAMNVNYSEGSFRVSAAPAFDSAGNYSIILETEAAGTEIRYSMDKNDPTNESAAYTGPIAISSDVTIHALAFKDGKPRGKTSIIPVVYHKALGKNFSWNSEPSYKYKGSGNNALLDGLRGSIRHNDGKWVGFEGNNLDIVVDLGDMMEVSSIEAYFLHDQKRWIFAPDEVSFYFSLDGKEYTNFTHDLRGFDKKTPDPVILKGFNAELGGPVKTRYVRVLAVNQGICPAWHPGAGNKAWIFADEIVIK